MKLKRKWSEREQIQTTLTNGIDARKYLATLISKIGTNPSDEKLENLLPRKIQL